MKVSTIKDLLEPYGKITHIYLAPEGNCLPSFLPSFLPLYYSNSRGGKGSPQKDWEETRSAGALTSRPLSFPFIISWFWLLYFVLVHVLQVHRGLGGIRQQEGGAASGAFLKQHPHGSWKA